MTQAESVIHYDKLILNEFREQFFGKFYNVGYWDAETTDPIQASRQLIARVIQDVHTVPHRILDVGCGIGAVSNEMKQKWPAAHITGINISQRQVDCATETFPDCTFQCMDATKLAFESNSFDLVVSIEAAHHFDTRIDFLKEAYRVLKPNSKLCMTDLCVYDETQYEAMYVFDVAKTNYMESIEAYAEILRGIGFKEVVIEDVNAQTWQPWILQIVKNVEIAFQQNKLTEQVYNSWVNNKDYIYGAAEYYLTVSATK